jgi:hypothetical protein
MMAGGHTVKTYCHYLVLHLDSTFFIHCCEIYTYNSLRRQTWNLFLKSSNGSYNKTSVRFTQDSAFGSRDITLYRVSQEECARIKEVVPYVKVYRYNPKHLCPKLNGYGDNGQRKCGLVWGSTHCTCQLTVLSVSSPWVWFHIIATLLTLAVNCVCTSFRVTSALGIHVSCIVLGTLRTTMTWMRVFL